MLQGGCHCGGVRYEMPSQVVHHSLCHCRDCRTCAGAPMVAWAAVKREDFKVTGEPQTYRSSEHATRAFCGRCGTGLYYVNEAVLPGLVDVQTATLDDPEALAPQLHVQVAERIGWVTSLHALPEFERYPG
ncbi:GFA family protein [Sphingosinicella sp. CPCC 101087]|uniref:GFA family protein n=1 Tax=Sphingosinicella sp. CPCC 101087 TaxID=2497754 RepID=UPI00101BDF14|nr:GFA family protein [Sphingosinicella sp. CPCC 101087]